MGSSRLRRLRSQGQVLRTSSDSVVALRSCEEQYLVSVHLSHSADAIPYEADCLSADRTPPGSIRMTSALQTYWMASIELHDGVKPEPVERRWRVGGRIGRGEYLGKRGTAPR